MKKSHFVTKKINKTQKDGKKLKEEKKTIFEMNEKTIDLLMYGHGKSPQGPGKVMKTVKICIYFFFFCCTF